MRAFFLTVLVVGFATAVEGDPLEGGFTPAEASTILLLQGGLNAGLDVMAEFCDFSGNEPDCLDMRNATYAHAQALGWLLHLNTHANSAQGDTILADRAGTVVYAWGVLDLALSHYNRADSFKTLMDWQAAVSSIAVADRTLPYATPYPTFPESPLGSDEQNQFGPHGQYRSAQQSLWRTFRYNVAGTLGAWFNAKSAGEVPLPCPVEGGVKVVANLAEAGKGVITTILMSAHVVDAAAGFSQYRTDAEETLAQEAKHALTEIHFFHGPGDSTFSTNTTTAHRVANALQGVGACFRDAAPSAGGKPSYGTFLIQFADGWNDLDAWVGHFNVIR